MLQTSGLPPPPGKKILSDMTVSKGQGPDTTHHETVFFFFLFHREEPEDFRTRSGGPVNCRYERSLSIFLGTLGFE